MKNATKNNSFHVGPNESDPRLPYNYYCNTTTIQWTTCYENANAQFGLLVL